MRGSVRGTLSNQRSYRDYVKEELDESYNIQGEWVQVLFLLA